jgi:hypothetical protein
MKKITELTRSIEISVEPQWCYEVICDIPAYRSWFRHITSQEVKHTNGEGRPDRVLYTFDLLIKKGMQLILNYEYDDDERKLHFKSGGGDIAAVTGYYHFREIALSNTLLVFTLKVDFGMLMPESIVNFLSGKVLDDFLVMVKQECETRPPSV